MDQNKIKYQNPKKMDQNPKIMNKKWIKKKKDE